MNLKEIRNSSTEDLKKMVSDYKRQLFAIRYKAAGGDTEGAKKADQTRKIVARILTVLKEREMAKAGGSN